MPHSLLDQLLNWFLTGGEISDTVFLTCLFMLCAPVTEHSHSGKKSGRPLLEILSLRSGLFPQGKSVTRIDLGKKKTSAVSNSFLKKKHHYLPNNKRLSYIQLYIQLYSAHTLWKIIDKAIMQLQQVSLAFTWTCWMCIIWMCTITISRTDKLQ